LKVAIMGAGLSGLTCAIMLEKYGVSPTIFEKRNKIGDRFVNAEALLPVLNRPINDDIAYLADTYGIYLQPLSNIRKINIFSENKTASIEGHLGFINIRGRENESFENQLSRQVKSKILFNSKYTHEELLKEFTHVIMATGDAAYTTKIQDYKVDLTVTLKGATVEGKFNRYTVGMWLNNSFAPQGYGYLLPYSEKEACISIGYPDYIHNQKQNLDELWEKFFQRVCKDFNQDLKITDRFEVTRYIIGMCLYPRLGNTFFVGNCFGSIMPAFGFGQLPAILTGIYAAEDLAGRASYLKLVKPLQKSYQNALILRKTLEQLDNNQLDKVISLLNTEIAQRILNSKRHDPLKIITYLLRPLTKLKVL